MGLATITSYIKSQIIQWLGHVNRRSEDETVKVVTVKKLIEKRPRGRPRKRWLYIIEENYKNKEYKNGKKSYLNENIEEQAVVVVVKTLKKIKMPDYEKKRRTCRSKRSRIIQSFLYTIIVYYLQATTIINIVLKLYFINHK